MENAVKPYLSRAILRGGSDIERNSDMKIVKKIVVCGTFIKRYLGLFT